MKKADSKRLNVWLNWKETAILDQKNKRQNSLEMKFATKLEIFIFFLVYEELRVKKLDTELLEAFLTNEAMSYILCDITRCEKQSLLLSDQIVTCYICKINCVIAIFG